MKEVQTTCPFCSWGCKLGIRWDGGRIRVEYPKDGRYNQGRLCPRGNGAGLILSSPRRLVYPLWGEEEVGWDDALGRIVDLLARTSPTTVGVLLGNHISQEERSEVLGLAQALGVETTVSGELGPQVSFYNRLARAQPARFELLARSQVFCIVGDLFSQVPVSSKPVLDARYREGSNRILVVDSLKTRTACFADEFVQPLPGTEPLAILGMIKAGFERSIEELALVDISEACGVEPQTLERAGQEFDRADTGVAILVPSIGRQGHPGLLSLATQLLAKNGQGEKGYLLLWEGVEWRGSQGFGELLSRITGDRVKVLLSFGVDLPEEYPQLSPVMRKLNQLISFTPFRPRRVQPNRAYLPLPTNLERQGTIRSSWGELSLTGVEPVSGARPLGVVLSDLSRRLGVKLEPLPPFEPTPPVTDDLVLEWIQSVMAGLKERQGPKRKRRYPFLLVGEQPAFGFFGLFGEDKGLKLNPADMERLGLEEGDEVGVRSAQGELSLQARVSFEVPPGVAVLNTSLPENRGVFQILIDPRTQDPIIAPVPVRLWKIGA